VLVEVEKEPAERGDRPGAAEAGWRRCRARGHPGASVPRGLLRRRRAPPPSTRKPARCSPARVLPHNLDHKLEQRSPATTQPAPRFAAVGSLIQGSQAKRVKALVVVAHVLDALIAAGFSDFAA